MSSSRASSHRTGEEGFTLPEVLLVAIIIGLLAAIALPQFLGERDNGEDAAAKHNARNVATLVEACATDGDDYRECDDPTDLRDSNVAFGSGPGQVEVDAPGAREYTITARSKSGTRFTLARATTGGRDQTCAPSGAGGCGDDGHW